LFIYPKIPTRGGKEAMMSNERSDQRKVMFQAMYRWSILTMLILGSAVFAISLAAHGWEGFAADPLSFLAGVLVRALVGPLVAVPFLLNYYRGKMTGKTYIEECKADDWKVATGVMIALAFILSIAFDGAVEPDGMSQETANFSFSVIICCIIGIAYALARALPVLLAVHAIICSLILLINSYEGFVYCGYYLVITSGCFAVIRLIVLVYDAVVNPGEINESIKLIAKRFWKWVLPQFEEKT